MGVGVDIGVVGDTGALVEDDLSAVVEHDVFVDGAGVFDGEVVAVGELDVVEDFDVLAEVTEDAAASMQRNGSRQWLRPTGERSNIARTRLGLADGVFFGVDVAVVLGLEGGVEGVEALDRGCAWRVRG